MARRGELGDWRMLCLPLLLALACGDPPPAEPTDPPTAPPEVTSTLSPTLPPTLPPTLSPTTPPDDTPTLSPTTRPDTPTPGPAGSLALSSLSVGFPQTAVGTSSQARLEVANAGDGSLTLTGASFSQPVFSLTEEASSLLGTALPPGGYLTLTLQFSPLEATSYTATMSLSSDDPRHPKVSISLSGVGLPVDTSDADGDGVSVAGGDCDDRDASTYPGALEHCDQADNDCDGSLDEEAVEAFTVYPDGDSDGYASGLEEVKTCLIPVGYVTQTGDCDDGDGLVYPGAAEACDGQDNDCDGASDEEGASLFYADADGDGHGDPTTGTLTCLPDGGLVSRGDDCDDQQPALYPGAEERCDGLDNDCDGSIDEGATDAVQVFPDEDGDGYGRDGEGKEACSLENGWASQGGDCDDTAAGVNPAAAERCDGVDQDCDGQVDDGASDASPWYLDADGDGHGTSLVSQRACEAPAGFVDLSDDCQDSQSQVYPGADEPCDGMDNDCDGQVDEAGKTKIYRDVDGDGFGDSQQVSEGCAVESGYAGRGGDCNDASSSVYPGASEVCDGVDQDCDGAVDEGVMGHWYLDGDGDGYGAGSGVEACQKPSSQSVSLGEDCDDRLASVHPGAVEKCNGLDDDCDGLLDEPDAADAGLWYEDGDGDGYGWAGSSQRACQRPTGYVANGTDCQDGDAAVHPGALEQCNAVDDDCDGSTDEAAVDAQTFYLDADGDGFGGASSLTTCVAPSGYGLSQGDCRDDQAGIYPGASEVCDGQDQDCDGQVDEGVETTYYADEDGDGFGDPLTSLLACAAPAGYGEDATDCDDSLASVHPAGEERCNARDDDCDGEVDEPSAVDASTFYQDADGDGFGNASVATVSCVAPGGFVADSRDCDDGDGEVNPGGLELCNGIDDDCDGVQDEPDAADAPVWYLDGDKDDFGWAGTSQPSCEAPPGYVADATDCNDALPLVNPAEDERCNGIDDDCDGATDEPSAVDATTFYWDHDGDGYGLGLTTVVACQQPAGYVTVAGDCNDDVASTHPGATELPADSTDNDCDGKVDENGSLAQLSGGRTGHSTVFDPLRERLLVFGGQQSFDLSDDVYSLDLSGGNRGVWQQLLPSGTGPSPLTGHVACYDSLKDRMIVFGGQGYYGLSNSVWALSFSASEEGVWSQLSPSGVAPTPRGNASAVFDQAGARMLLYGGQPYYDLSAELWSLDLSRSVPAWSSLTGSTLSPGPRQGHGLVVDTVFDRLILVGGDTYYERLSDVWTWSMASGQWTKLTVSGTFPALSQAMVSFHETASELLVFGGRGYYDLSDDLYAMTLTASSSGTWRQLSPTSSSLAPASGGGAVVLEGDALDVVVFGQGYYGLVDRPYSLGL